MSVSLSMPTPLIEQLRKAADKKEHSFQELLYDAILRYEAKKQFHELVKKGRKVAKEKGLKPEDFGGPFED